MTTNIHIRGVSDELADRIRSQAKQRKLSISNYLLSLAEQDAATIPLDEWLDLVGTRPSMVAPGTDIAALVREDRSSH